MDTKSGKKANKLSNINDTKDINHKKTLKMQKKLTKKLPKNLLKCLKNVSKKSENIPLFYDFDNWEVGS